MSEKAEATAKYSKWWWYLRPSYFKWLRNPKGRLSGDEAVRQVKTDMRVKHFTVDILSYLIPSRILCFLGIHNYHDKYHDLHTLTCNKCDVSEMSIIFKKMLDN